MIAIDVAGLLVEAAGGCRSGAEVACAGMTSEKWCIRLVIVSGPATSVKRPVGDEQHGRDREERAVRERRRDHRHVVVEHLLARALERGDPVLPREVADADPLELRAPRARAAARSACRRPSQAPRRPSPRRRERGSGRRGGLGVDLGASRSPRIASSRSRRSGSSSGAGSRPRPERRAAPFAFGCPFVGGSSPVRRM